MKNIYFSLISNTKSNIARKIGLDYQFTEIDEQIAYDIFFILKHRLYDELEGYKTPDDSEIPW